MKTLIVANGEVVKDGDRVYTYTLGYTKVYGTLHHGETFLSNDSWYVDYDDGESCVVLEPYLIWKSDTVEISL